MRQSHITDHNITLLTIVKFQKHYSELWGYMARQEKMQFQLSRASKMLLLGRVETSSVAWWGSDISLSSLGSLTKNIT